MKNIIARLFLLLNFIPLSIFAQYFRGSIVIDNSANPTKLRFMIRANPVGGNITNVYWDKLEMFVRNPTEGTAPVFGNVTVNNADFPGLVMQKGGLGVDFENGLGTEDGYTIYYFPSSVSENATNAPRSYTAGQDYEVFNVTITAGSYTQLEFAANQADQSPYYLTLLRNTTGSGGEADMTATGPLAGPDAATNHVFYGSGISTLGSNFYQKPGLLPVQFLSFYALKNGDDAKLNWTVSNDQDNKYFEVERSVNGRKFASFIKVNALANGKSTNTYETADLRLSSLGSKLVYYRIKQVDNNGQILYSAVRNLNLNAKGAGISLFPNPARTTTKMVIDAEMAGKATISIRDAGGRQVQMISTELVKGINQKDLNVSALPSGEYNVTVMGENINQTIKLSKIN